MKRFIKTVTVRRHVQFLVVQDGQKHEFAVLRYAAEDDKPEEVCAFDYLPHDDRFTLAEAVASQNDARGKAIAEAQRLAEAEKAGRQAMNVAEVD
jgi:hypothetical protein